MELCLELAYIHLGTLSVFERRGRYYGANLQKIGVVW